MSQTLLGQITEFQEAHPYIVVTVFAFLTLAMIPGMGKIETVVALENMMPASSEPVQEFNQLRAQGAGKDSIALKIETGTSDTGVQTIDDRKTRKYINQLEERMADVYGVEQVYSPLKSPGLIDDDKSTAVMIAYTYVGDDGAEMSRIFEDIEEEASYNRPEGLETSISGVPAVQQRLASMVQRDKNVTTIISLLLVFIITWILFRGSLTAALMPLLVVALSVTWLYGTMGHLGIPLSTLAGSVAALVIGIGIAYAIHIGNIYRFKRRDNTVKEALVEAVDDIGVSIIASAITTISAFLAFLAGKMPEMHRFGLIMSLGIGYAVLFTILLLPAVFTIEEGLMVKIRDSLDWREGIP